MQGNGCSRTIFIDSKVLLGWSNGQRQINNWAGLMILLISIYKWKKFTFTDVQDFDSLNIRISSRQNKEWLLNFESCNLVWNHTRDLKSDKREARVRFEVTIVISDQNYTTRSSVTTLLQPFWNRRIQSVPIFTWPSSRFVESGTKKLLHLFLYPKEKWCNIKQKWCV